MGIRSLVDTSKVGLMGGMYSSGHKQGRPNGGGGVGTYSNEHKQSRPSGHKQGRSK